MDPQIIWDLEHPFQASIELTQQLHSIYGIVNNHLDLEVYEKAMEQSDFLLFHRKGIGGEPVGLYHYEKGGSYELERRTRDESGKRRTESIHIVTVGVTYQWRLPTVDLTRIDSSKEPIVENVHGQELPGISVEELASHLCDFLALNQMRTWAERNLKATDGKLSGH